MLTQTDSDVEVPPESPIPYDVLAGVIIGAHGVQGGLKIKIATSTAISLIKPENATPKAGTTVWLARLPYGEVTLPDDSISMTGGFHQIKQVKELQPGGRVLLLKIQGITDRSEAEALVGLSVYAPKERRAVLADDEYFSEDLIGLEIISESGRNFGKITAVLQQPGNDVYETDKGALIPAVKAVVRKVDLNSKTIIVADILGLFQTEADEVITDASDHEPPVKVDDTE